MNDLQQAVLLDRYTIENESTWEEVAARVADATGDNPNQRKEFYEMLSNMYFLGGGRTLFAMGNPAEVTANNCNVLPMPEDSRQGIMESLTMWIEIQARGGGVGINMSSLRPSGSPVRTVRGTSSGPLNWMELFSVATHRVVQQGGSRRGAAMLVLNDNHPDVFSFVRAKRTPGILMGANLSVGVSDSFMEAVKNDEEWKLTWNGEVFNTVRARDLWDEIISSAWASGEPGVIFLERAQKESNAHYLTLIEATNPCLIGSTRMLTREGLIPIENIANTDFYTPGGWSQGSAWYTGKKDVVQVILSNGQRITTTPDHKFVVGESMEEARDLEGLDIEPFLGDGTWEGDDGEFTGKDLIQLGFLQGDGHRQASGGMYVNIGQKDGDVASLFPDAKPHGKGTHQRYLGVNSKEVQLAQTFGLSLDPLPERTLPERVFGLSPFGVKMFLRGLFSANGSAHRTVNRVSLKSTNLDLVTGVQQLLMALGFRPYITTNKPQSIKWPNGTYTSRTAYDLNIAGSELAKFRIEVGFIQEYKQQRLYEINVKASGRRIAPTVVAVVPLEEASVFDFNVHDPTHVGWANGLAVSNCGEVPMEAFGSCLLGSVNLAKLTEGKDWKIKDIHAITALGVQFLDNIIDRMFYPLPEIEMVQRKMRRVGLGTIGLADALINMKVRYGEEEAVDKTEEVFRTIKNAAYHTSIGLAVEKDPFPAFDPVEHSKGTFIQGLAPSLQRSIREHGIRNCFLTSQAPTGTIGKLAGVWSGIEPYFSKETYFVNRLGRFNQFAPDSPYTVYAQDVSPEGHINMMVAAQKHIDQSVSKTVNAPEHHTLENTASTYDLAYLKGAKSVAYYRDKSREVQVQYSSKEEADNARLEWEDPLACSLGEGVCA